MNFEILKKLSKEQISRLFQPSLNLLAPNAQASVPVPEGLDLEEWIYAPGPEVEEEDVGKFDFEQV